MDYTLQLKVKVSCLFQQFVPGQTEPSMESLRMYQISREEFRQGLLLLKVDQNGQNQQQEVQFVMDASNNEVAKDRKGVSLEDVLRGVSDSQSRGKSWMV